MKKLIFNLCIVVSILGSAQARAQFEINICDINPSICGFNFCDLYPEQCNNWILRPDFSITSIFASGCHGRGSDAQPTVGVRIKNLGVVSGSTDVDVFLGLFQAPDLGDTSTISRHSPTINPGSTRLMTFALPSSYQNRSTYVDVILDTYEVSGDSDMSNNIDYNRITFPDCYFH